MDRGSSRAALLAIALAVLVSCADTKNWIATRIHEEPATSAEEAPSTRSIVQKARRHMQADEFQEAIDVYHAGYRKLPQDQVLLAAYIQSLEDMAGAADLALERQAIGAAGKTYDILLKNYPRFGAFEKKLAFDRTRLNEKLEYCKKTLFKKGFQEYRQGNLSQSIALWEALLVIDPQNTDIQEALRTARLQQKNLREKE